MSDGGGKARDAAEVRASQFAANVLGMVYQYAYWPDGTHGYTFVSEGARTLFGIDPAAAMREPNLLLDLIHRDDWPTFQAYARQAAATLEALKWEGRINLPSGDERIVQITAQAERRSDGAVLSNGLITDVTELRRTKRRLEESEERYRSLFEQNPDAVYSFDLDGRFLSANPACESLSGYAPGELLGNSFEHLIVPEELEAVRALFAASAAGRPTQYETAIHHRTGRRVAIGVTNIPIVVGGRVVGVYGIAKNLTVQRELEQQLRQAQKMEAVGRLAGGVAHDFNNLLTVIAGYTQMALAEVPARSPIALDLQRVETATNRASALTRQLLAYSRRQMLKARRVDLNQTVIEATAMLRRVIGEDITIHTELGPALWAVYADPGQLSQVMMNLAVNARDAMPHGGTLTLKTCNIAIDHAPMPDRPGLIPGRYTTLVVEDTGTGIDASIRAHLFEPFYTTKPPGEGTGLGLATVYGIVKQSGGYVYADNLPEHGARFTVLLPATDELPEEIAPVAAVQPARGSETILLVEDEEQVRDATRRMLERLGYRVLDAASGSDAIHVASTAAERGMKIDLVLTDVVMPGMSGRLVGEWLTGAWPGMRVLYMSGYTDDEIFRRGLANRDTKLLEKPFTLERLATTLREVLGERQ